MSRRRVAVWLLSVPLMVAGTQVAHVFAYRLVYPQARVRLRELLLTGHGYMTGFAGVGGYLPLLLAVTGAVEVVGFGSIVAASVRRRRHAPVPPWAFALLPLVGFSLQEFLERWLAGAPFPLGVVLQPTFRVGLLLQLPFALGAFVLARLLLRAAERVGGVFLVGRRFSFARPRESGLGWFALVLCPPRVAALAGGHAERGPPL